MPHAVTRPVGARAVAASSASAAESTQTRDGTKGRPPPPPPPASAARACPSAVAAAVAEAAAAAVAAAALVACPAADAGWPVEPAALSPLMGDGDGDGRGRGRGLGGDAGGRGRVAAIATVTSEGRTTDEGAREDRGHRNSKRAFKERKRGCRRNAWPQGKLRSPSHLYRSDQACASLVLICPRTGIYANDGLKRLICLIGGTSNCLRTGWRVDQS